MANTSDVYAQMLAATFCLQPPGACSSRVLHSRVPLACSARARSARAHACDRAHLITTFRACVATCCIWCAFARVVRVGHTRATERAPIVCMHATLFPQATPLPASPFTRLYLPGASRSFSDQMGATWSSSPSPIKSRTRRCGSRSKASTSPRAPSMSMRPSSLSPTVSSIGALERRSAGLGSVWPNEPPDRD